MTSKLFWKSFYLHNNTVEKILYPHPIVFNWNTKSFMVNNLQTAKYIPFIASQILIASYFLICCFIGVLYHWKMVPLKIALLNIFFAGLCWNMLFYNAVHTSVSGQLYLESVNAIFRESHSYRKAQVVSMRNRKGTVMFFTIYSNICYVNYALIFECFVMF